jgi:glycosyltransferase involved in cell wall biosynthesis
MLKDKITIVIPCKNEENYIANLLVHLRWQRNIDNTRILIADCSTDNTRKIIDAAKGDLNVEIIEGGPVSIAKNNGARLVTTPYILFIDADVRFFNDNVIQDAVDALEKNNLDLVGLASEMPYKEKTCPTCQTKHTKRGEYCSRSCGNTRPMPEHQKDSIRSAKKEWIQTDKGEVARWQLNNHDAPEPPLPPTAPRIGNKQFVQDGDLWEES